MNDDDELVLDSNILSFVKSNVNPVNVEVYVEGYTTLAKESNTAELDTKLLYLMSKIGSLDPSFIGISINTIFKEVFRGLIVKLGISISWDIELRSLVSLYDIIDETLNHPNLVDLLRDTPSTEFELSDVFNNLGFDAINLIEYIEDFDRFKVDLYDKHREEILYSGVEIV